MRMKPSVVDRELLLNVDLEIHSRSNLQPLVDALGGKVIVHYVGLENRHYKARLMLKESHRKSQVTKHQSAAEAITLGFCKLIHELPPEARKLWNSAWTRDFDVGIESGKPGSFYWFELTPAALRVIAELNAKVSVTIYGPMKITKKSVKSQ
jgi:hypothetical protein